MIRGAHSLKEICARSGGDGRKTRAQSGAAGTDGRTNIESVKRTKKSLL